MFALYMHRGVREERGVSEETSDDGIFLSLNPVWSRTLCETMSF
jgi:hypothetical protein